MWRMLAFLAIPIIEIAVFIQVGSLIGLWPTIGLVVLSMIAGQYLLRNQGAQTMLTLRRVIADRRDPGQPLAEGAMILLAGVLLIIPGFLTDILGFALLIPVVRAALFRRLTHRMTARRAAAGYRPAQDYGQQARGTPAPPHNRPQSAPVEVIDAEYEEVAPPKKPTHQPSGWTKH